MWSPPLVPGHGLRSLQHFVHLGEVHITEQRRNSSALRNTLLTRRFQQQLEKPQDRFIAYSPRHFLQYNMMSHSVEVGSQIEIDDVGLALHDCIRYAPDGSVC